MKFSTFVLLSAAVVLGIIGIGYVLAPQWAYGLYGIGIESVSEANMVRAAYYYSRTCSFRSLSRSKRRL